MALTHGKVAAEFDKVTERTFRRAAKLKGGLTEWNKQEQYEGHAQLIFRLRDQYGEEVTDYDITFRSTRSGSANRIERMIEDKHVNTKNPSVTTYYLRTQKFESDNEAWTDRLLSTATVDFEITGHETDSEDIAYVPLSVRLTPQQVQRVLQTFRTTVVDVELVRLPSQRVFRLTPS